MWRNWVILVGMLKLHHVKQWHFFEKRMAFCCLRNGLVAFYCFGILVWILNSFYIIFQIDGEILKKKTLSFIIKGFRTIVFIFISISITIRPICPAAFFRCLSNLGSYTELWTTSFIESKGIACSDSVSYNRVQEFSIPVLLLACSQDWTCNLQMNVSLEA